MPGIVVSARMETGKPKDWPSGIVWGSPKREVDWANVRQLHEADMHNAKMLSDYEAIKVPGTKVLLMRGGQWEGPFIVQSGEGRTAEHLILLNPRGNTLFEEHVDAYSVGYQIKAV
jgi:hypothetical protein